MVAKNREMRKGGSVKKTIVLTLLMIILVFVAGVLIVSNLEIRRRRVAIGIQAENLDKQIKELEEKNKELERSMAQVGSQEYLEKLAREQFNMKSPGEEVVVISKEKQKENTPEQKEKETWWQWVRDLFGFK